MEEEVECPSCGEAMIVDEEMFGKTVACPSCDNKSTVQEDDQGFYLEKVKTKKPGGGKSSGRMASVGGSRGGGSSRGGGTSKLGRGDSRGGRSGGSSSKLGSSRGGGSRAGSRGSSGGGGSRSGGSRGGSRRERRPHPFEGQMPPLVLVGFIVVWLFAPAGFICCLIGYSEAKARRAGEGLAIAGIIIGGILSLCFIAYLAMIGWFVSEVNSSPNYGGY
ncbi:MAG: hypothetical protein NUW37_02185 [Planctomycetes bacterium]|nr:hypothetical protein [Planctomycetota bacterium]